jgi:hypothetical protein
MSPRVAAGFLGVGAARGEPPAVSEQERDLAAASERAMRRFTLIWRIAVVAVIAAGIMVASALASPSRIAEDELIWLTPYHSRA